MNHLNQIKSLPILIVLVTFVSANPSSNMPLGNTVITWILCFTTIACVLYYKSLYFFPNNRESYRIVHLYFLWMLCGVIRGYFVAGNYWEGKQLIEGSLALSLPVFVYVFSIPQILQTTLRVWIKIALPAFALFFFWVLHPTAYNSYLDPALLLLCFFPIIPKKWKIISLSLLVLMIIPAVEARSQAIKAVIALSVGMAYWASKFLNIKLLKTVHWLCYILPIVFLTTGITGVFNPLEAMGQEAEKLENTKYTYGEHRTIADDTRSALYEEIITSAVRNEYVWQGRTPARGNDSWIFGGVSAEVLKTGVFERHENEFCHPNVFTWLGLIGVILYGLIYLKSSYLAIFRSNNLWMKLLGVFIAFRWAFGWLEDINRFDVINITLWMMISMGFSEQFRKMTTEEFNGWILKIFQR